MPESVSDVLAPCGFYCAVCLDNIVNHCCHGCGCSCGHCAGAAHVDLCDIARCARDKGYETCAECNEMPCTQLILFTHHPFCIHHQATIEILRRVQRVGKEQVLQELREAFADEEKRLRRAFIEEYGGKRAAAFDAWREERE